MNINTEIPTNVRPGKMYVKVLPERKVVNVGGGGPQPPVGSHWPGEDSPVDIISGHDMLGVDDDGNYPVAIVPHYVVGVIGKAFDFHLGKVRGITPPHTDLNVQSNSEFTIEGYFKVDDNEADLSVIAHNIPFEFAPGEYENIASFLIYPVKPISFRGFGMDILNSDFGDKYLWFAFPDHDAWTPNVAFYLRLTYQAGTWNCYVDTIEVPLTEVWDNNPAPIKDDVTGATWSFNNWSDEIKFSKAV
jgi:hypothetical protein